MGFWPLWKVLHPHTAPCSRHNILCNCHGESCGTSLVSMSISIETNKKGLGGGADPWSTPTSTLTPPPYYASHTWPVPLSRTFPPLQMSSHGSSPWLSKVNWRRSHPHPGKTDSVKGLKGENVNRDEKLRLAEIISGWSGFCQEASIKEPFLFLFIFLLV